MKQMRVFSIVGVLIGLATAATAFAEGSGGSVKGDGKVWVKHWWNKAEDGSKYAPYEKSLGDFVKANPGATIHTCSKVPSLRFPILTAKQADELGIAGLRDPESYCASRGLARSYGVLVMTLVEKISQDEVTRYALQRISTKGGPVQVTIESAPRRTKARGGYTLDDGWVDSKGALHWARRAYWGSPAGLFKHELGHILLDRSFGGAVQIPSDSHDIRIGRDNMYGPGIVKSSTSYQAAFVEGLADAMEHPYVFDNPYFYTWGNFNEIASDTIGKEGEQKKELCYFSPWQMKLDPATGELYGPFTSEMYMVSTIDLFLRAEEPYSYERTNTTRAKFVIDAILKAPLEHGVFDLARNYDQVSGTDFGWRWLREYFFFDYKTGKNTASEFHQEKDEFSETFATGGMTFCTDIASANRFVSPLLRQEDEASLAARQAEYDAQVAATAATVSSETLAGQAEAARADYSKRFDSLLELFGKTVDEMIQVQTEVSQRLSRCSEKPAELPRKEFYEQTMVQSFALNPMMRMNLNFSYIDDFLAEGCVDPSKRTWAKSRANLAQESALAKQVTVPGTAEHFARYKAIESTGSALNGELGQLARFMTLFQVLKNVRADGTYASPMQETPPKLVKRHGAYFEK